MPKAPTLTDVNQLNNNSLLIAINSNNDAIQTSFENTLSLDGSTPNAMGADLDMNNNDINNVSTLTADDVIVNGFSIASQIVIPRRILQVYMHVDAVDNLTLTNQASAADFLGGSSRVIQLADLADFTEVRLTARVRVTSTSANTPRIYGVYSTTFSSDSANYTALGATTPAQISLATVGVVRSSWVTLATGARLDDIYIAVLQAGGDDTADPSLGYVMLEFR